MQRRFGILAGFSALVALLSTTSGASATAIDFQTYSTGTALTSLDGITFSLMGGPDSTENPLIGYSDSSIRGLSNSDNFDYPTANILDFAFSSPVSGVSFFFDNYGDNDSASFYQAFNAAHTLIASGNLGSEDGLENNILSVGGIADLQFNNGQTSEDSWYFVIPSITFTAGSVSAVPEPASLSLLLAGLGVIGGASFFRKKRSRA